MTTKELDVLQALCDGATAGPWHTEDVGEPPKRRWVVDAQYRCVAGGTAGGLGPRAFDADFIAAARTALPALIAEVRRLRERCEAAEADLQTCGDCDACRYGGDPFPGWREKCGDPCIAQSNFEWRGPQPTKEATQ